MKVKLTDVAKINFGVYASPSSKGSVKYLHARHFDDLGYYLGNTDTFLEGNEKMNSNFLEVGDILFVSKGFRFFATEVKENLVKTIASSIFFVLKPYTDKVFPSYLVTILNLPQNLAYFNQLSAGSSIPSIRKTELADFTFNLIPLNEQQNVIAVNEFYLKEIELSQKIIKQKQIRFQSVISHLINK